MSKAQLLFALPILVPFCALAQNGPVQISQSSIAATGLNRATNGFPFTITQSGSYQLTSNLVVPAGVDGIDIPSNNVTLDLNGFTISGPVTCTGSGLILHCTAVFLQTGIASSSTSTNVTIRNGSVVGFSTGVDLEGQGNLVEEVHVSGNTAAGIVINNGVARRNTANLNVVGIVANESTVTENVANFNVINGLAANNGGLYGSNTFYSNGVVQVSGSGSLSQNNNSCDGTAC